MGQAGKVWAKAWGQVAPSVVKDNSTTPVPALRVAFSLPVRDRLHMVGLTLRPWFGEIMDELVQGASA